MHGDTWQQKSPELYGATILHYRRALIDQATGSRTITIETRFCDGDYTVPPEDDSLAIIFRKLGESICASDIETGQNRVHDIWAPILAVAKLVKDKDWLQWAETQMESAIEDLRDGHAYKVAGIILAHVVKTLTDERNNQIICRQLKVQEDIIEPLRRHEQIKLSPWQASRQLKDLGFALERVGGQNKFTPTLESIRRAADKISYQDVLLQ